jgi:hypothetical protein
MTYTPHLLKKGSLFAMFCLSYLPLFLLISLRIIFAKYDKLNYTDPSWWSINTFLIEFGFVVVLIILSLYSILGTYLTFKNIKRNLSNADPIIVNSVEPKNEESLSYLATYVIPLVSSEKFGPYEYVLFGILFFMYYKLYSSSSMILINPVLNVKYGLFSIEYFNTQKPEEMRKALIIFNHKWIDEGEKIYVTKLSHRLYFAHKK